MSVIRKTLTGALAAATLTAGIIAASAPAEAQWRRGHHRGGWGAPVAAGVIGGLALGALAAQAAQPRYYYAPGYTTYPAYGYGAYHYPAYTRTCWRQRQPAYDRWGNFVGYRSVRVCN
jgi:hypothetical protein